MTTWTWNLAQVAWDLALTQKLGGGSPSLLSSRVSNSKEAPLKLSKCDKSSKSNLKRSSKNRWLSSTRQIWMKNSEMHSMRRWNLRLPSSSGTSTQWSLKTSSLPGSKTLSRRSRRPNIVKIASLRTPAKRKWAGFRVYEIGFSVESQRLKSRVKMPRQQLQSWLKSQKRVPLIMVMMMKS